MSGDVPGEKNLNLNKHAKTGSQNGKKCWKPIVYVIVCFINFASIVVFIAYLITPSYAEDCNRVNEEPDESALCIECRFFLDKKAGEKGGLCCSANLTVLDRVLLLFAIISINSLVYIYVCIICL